MKWFSDNTKSSTVCTHTTLKEHFEYVFAFIDNNDNLQEQLFNETDYYMQRDSTNQIAKCQRNKFKTFYSKYTKKIIKRDLYYLRRLIQDDGAITNDEHYLSKAEKVLLKHFGKYEIKNIDIKNLGDILNCIRRVKEKKTLIFDTTTEYHSYKKTDKNNMSLKSQMESIFIEHGYYKKITTYFQHEHKAKNPLKPFNLQRQPPPKTMYKYVVTEEVNKTISDFLKEIHVRDSRK